MKFKINDVVMIKQLIYFVGEVSKELRKKDEKKFINAIGFIDYILHNDRNRGDYIYSINLGDKLNKQDFHFSAKELFYIGRL